MHGNETIAGLARSISWSTSASWWICSTRSSSASTGERFLQLTSRRFLEINGLCEGESWGWGRHIINSKGLHTYSKVPSDCNHEVVHWALHCRCLVSSTTIASQNGPAVLMAGLASFLFSAGTLQQWWAHCTWSGWYGLSCGSCREGSVPSSWPHGASLESTSRNMDRGQVGWFPCVHSVPSLCPSIVSLTPVCTFHCWSDSRVPIPLLPFQL